MDQSFYGTERQNNPQSLPPKNLSHTPVYHIYDQAQQPGCRLPEQPLQYDIQHLVRPLREITGLIKKQERSRTESRLDVSDCQHQ